MRVIASSIRKGNIIEQDGKLYVVVSAENIHPGKGTPVSQIEMRRIQRRGKDLQRYKTTDQVEKATVEERNFNYLYEDGDGYHSPETYDQVQVSKDIVGDAAAYLQENMVEKLSLHDMNPISVALPQRATLEVVETGAGDQGPDRLLLGEGPPALSNGVRTAVPPHVAVGTRIVVMTEDGVTSSAQKTKLFSRRCLRRGDDAVTGRVSGICCTLAGGAFVRPGVRGLAFGGRVPDPLDLGGTRRMARGAGSAAFGA